MGDRSLNLWILDPCIGSSRDRHSSRDINIFSKTDTTPILLSVLARSCSQYAGSAQYVEFSLPPSVFSSHCLSELSSLRAVNARQVNVETRYFIYISCLFIRLLSTPCPLLQSCKHNNLRKITTI